MPGLELGWQLVEHIVSERALPFKGKV